jgi:hypothetical protein
MIATFGKTEAAMESIAAQWQLVLHDSDMNAACLAKHALNCKESC